MVLLVNQHTVPIFSDIANAYADRGKKVVLFTGHIEKGGRPLSSEIRIKKSIRYNRKSSLSRFITWMIFTAHYAFYLTFCRKPELILVATNPPLTPVVSAPIAALRRIPLYIVLYDLYPEALFQAGMVDSKNIAFRIWARINRWMFNRTAGVFTLSESMKEAASRYLRPDKEVSVISNWADTSYVHPIDKTLNPFIKEHGLENKFVVLYSGNMGLTHDLESLIKAAVLLKEERRLIFVLIGDGGKRRNLQDLVSKTNPGNVLFLPFQDENNFPQAMAAADLGVVTLGVGAEGISVPSKTYVNFAAGLCLLSIAPASSELCRLIRENDAGMICEPGHPEQVAEAIRILMNDEQRLNYYKDRALEASASFTPVNAYQYVDQTVSASQY